MKLFSSVAITLLPLFVGAQYVAEILPTPNGGGTAAGAGSGQIVGGAFGPGGGPSLWDGPKHNYIDLTPAGYDFAEVFGVGGGKQVGYGFTNNDTRALIWSSSASKFVDVHPNGYTGSVARATDGSTQVGDAAVGVNLSHAALWSGTAQSFVDLHPKGYEWSIAFGVDGGVQVGMAENLPVIWRGSATSVVQLPQYKGGLGGAGAIAGNQIVGVSNAGGSAHALLWDATTFELTVLGEGRVSDTNGNVQVGFSGSIGEERAKAWFSTPGSELDLHQFLPGSFVESRALGIDENGTIVGTGQISGIGQVPIIWTPVPEPATFLALGTCTTLLILSRRRRR